MPSADSKPGRTGRKAWRLLGLLPVPIILVGLGIPPLLNLLIERETRPQTRAYSPAQAVGSVAGTLMYWRVFGDIPESTAVRQTVERRLRGVNGFGARGWNNEGADWYEVELTPELAAEIEANLARAIAAEPSPPPDPFTLRRCPLQAPVMSSQPPWWPTRWPADAQAYSKNLTFFVLSPGAARAWLLVVFS